MADASRTTRERNIEAQPYTADELRVVEWLTKRSPGIGAGDDPIGFLLASYEYTHMQKQALHEALSEVWAWISNWDPPMKEDAEWPATSAKVVEALQP